MHNGKPHSWSHCVTISNSFLNKFGYIAKGILPIDVETLSNIAGYNVNVFHNISQFGIKGTAFKNNEQNKFEIIIDSWHYENDEFSYPFTIAEELAHIILHSDIFENVNNIEDRMSYESDTDEETYQVLEMEAKRLANLFLLPPVLFNPFVIDYVDKNIDLLKKENILNENDLVKTISKRLSPILSLSHFIIEKALLRYTPDKLSEVLNSKFSFY